MLARLHFDRQRLEDLLPVVITYVTSAIGLRFSGADQVAPDGDSGVLAGVLMVATVTLSHVVIPVLLFGVARRLIGDRDKPSLLWLSFCMTIWFGTPTLLLAAVCGWLSLPAAAAHIAFGRRGTRLWLAVEYGSTSFALLLFVLAFSHLPLVPWGLPVVVFQASVLTLVRPLASGLWIGRSEQTATDRVHATVAPPR